MVEHSLGELSRLAGVSEAVACWRNTERSASEVEGAVSEADVAQLVEHSLGKGEVISSILIIGSRDLLKASS